MELLPFNGVDDVGGCHADFAVRASAESANSMISPYHETSRLGVCELPRYVTINCVAGQQCKLVCLKLFANKLRARPFVEHDISSKTIRRSTSICLPLLQHNAEHVLFQLRGLQAQRVEF